MNLMIEAVNRSAGLRELQIAKALVSLRWLGIIIILSFSYFAKSSWNLSFSIIPIYLLVLLEAILNVLFTCHISLLSRQIFITKGLAAIKRLLIHLFYKLHKDITDNGILGITIKIPVFLMKLSSAVGLFILESLKFMHFNFLSLQNVLHTQIFFDILLLLLIIRFTGTAESPFVYLVVIPVIVAGAVIGYKAAFMYATLISITYLALCLLINIKIIKHIKYYGPHIGDLSFSTEWTYSSFLILYCALIGTAYFSSHLTKMFKERIFYLFQLLEHSRIEAESNNMLSKFSKFTWFLLNNNGEIVRYNLSMFKSFQKNLLGSKLTDIFIPLESLGFTTILQSCINSQKKYTFEKLKIRLKDNNLFESGNEIIINLYLIPHQLGSSKIPHILVICDDITLEVTQDAKIKEMTNTMNSYKLEIEKLSLENKELNQTVCQLHNYCDIKNKEIVELIEFTKKLEVENKILKNEKEEISRENITNKIELQNTKTELSLKAKAIEEIYEYLKVASNFENFISIVEKSVKQEYQLDYLCIHIFRYNKIDLIIDEFINSKRIPTKIIEFVKQTLNNNILETIILEQKPYIIEFDANNNNSLKSFNNYRKYYSFYGFIPINYDKKVLGIAICEKSLPNQDSHEIFHQVTNHIKRISNLLRTAIKIRDQENEIKLLQDKNAELNSILTDIFELVKVSFSSIQENSINNFIKLISKLSNSDEIIMFRYYNDGTRTILSRYINPDNSNSKLELILEEIYQSLHEDFSKPIKTKNKYDEDQYIYAYPLYQGNKFVGGLIIALQFQNEFTNSLLDIVAKLASENLSLMILNEEKEIWENFYREHLSA